MLGYLRSWKAGIQEREGNFCKVDQAKMFISWQTMEGIQINIASLPECVRFLLAEGFDYVLSEKFCQDPVEEYFGGQMGMGRRSENPDMYMFGYNNHALHIQKTISVTGNTRGRHQKRKQWDKVDNSALPKRKST